MLASALAWLRTRRPVFALALFAFGMYVLWIASMTFFPIPVDAGWRQSVAHILGRINFELWDFGGLFELAPAYAVHQIGGNLLLWVPLGFGACLLHALAGRQLNAWRVAWTVLGFGLAFELGQLALSFVIGAAYRSVDINDVLLNAFGTLLGCGLYALAALAWRKIRH